MFSQFFMQSTIDLFSVPLTSFFKQGKTAFRFDGITANNREEKKSPFARIYFRIQARSVLYANTHVRT